MRRTCGSSTSSFVTCSLRFSWSKLPSSLLEESAPRVPDSWPLPNRARSAACLSLEARWRPRGRGSRSFNRQAPDHFSALGIEHLADDRQIVKAYRSRMKALHPDRQAPAAVQPLTTADDDDDTSDPNSVPADATLQPGNAPIADDTLQLPEDAAAQEEVSVAAEPAEDAAEPAEEPTAAPPLPLAAAEAAAAEAAAAAAEAEAARAALEEAFASSQSRRLGALAASKRLTAAAGNDGVLRNEERRAAYVAQLLRQSTASAYATRDDFWVKEAMEELRLRLELERAEAAEAAKVAEAKSINESLEKLELSEAGREHRELEGEKDVEEVQLAAEVEELPTMLPPPEKVAAAHAAEAQAAAAKALAAPGTLVKEGMSVHYNGYEFRAFVGEDGGPVRPDGTHSEVVEDQAFELPSGWQVASAALPGLHRMHEEVIGALGWSAYRLAVRPLGGCDGFVAVCTSNWGDAGTVNGVGEVEELAGGKYRSTDLCTGLLACRQTNADSGGFSDAESPPEDTFSGRKRKIGV